MSRRHPNEHPPSKAAAGHVRLQRVMADAGVASRRECENLITQGLVEVNGARVDHLPVFVDPSNDRIVVDGRPLRPVRPSTAPAGPDAPRGVLPGRIYAMLHKPARVLCTTRDDGEGTPESGGRTTVTDLVQHSSGARLYPVGRLEYHATGLVLMTNDGALADRLTHARYGVTRTYRVTIKGRPTIELMRDLRRRLAAEKAETFEFPGRSTRGKRPDAGNDGPAIDPVRVVRRPGAMPAPGHTPDPSDNTVLEITLREGKSRQLKAILEQMGANTRKLTRVGIGPLRLRGVAVGQWRDLSREEVAALMRAGGLAPARQGKGA